MKGTIETVTPSKSGKTLGLKIEGVWYMTKEWELQNMSGVAIEFTPKIDSYQGKEQRWINEYTTVGGAPDGPPGTPGLTPPPGVSVATPQPNHRSQSASAARENNRGRPDLNDAAVENQLLLRFVGNGLAARSSDQEGVEPLAKILYKIGKDILSGRFDALTTRDPGEDDDIPY